MRRLLSVTLHLAIWNLVVWSALSQETSPQPMPSSSPSSSQPSATPAGNNSDQIIDRIERELQEKANSEAAASAQMPPWEPRTHRFTNQPLSRIFRILAEQAGINYVEPSFTKDELINVRLTNLTPLQAFQRIAEIRGFQVIEDDGTYSLRRSDIETPSFYITKQYVIKNKPAEWLLQPISNFLGIKLTPVDQDTPVYPKPASTPAAQNATSSGSYTSMGTDQTQPRYQPGLPFDAPLSTGGFGNRNANAVFLERSSNSLFVRATADEQDLVRTEIARLDVRERQILIKTYVVEVAVNNSVGGGIDWSQTLGLGQGQGATFTLSGKSQANALSPISAGQTATGQSIIGNLAKMGGFFPSGLVLNMSNVQVVLQALQASGRVLSNNSPMTVAKSGVPVTIRSDSKQTIFLQTSGTLEYGPNTTPYVFTTGVTIEVVARILAGGLVDMNINPTVSTLTGSQTAAQPGTNTMVPVIATRSTTADVTVASGQAAVIGGILQDSSSATGNGIPGISKIPVISYLFKTRSQSRTRTNLIIIVCPTIIPADNRRIDRLGSDERDTLLNSADLPGEPPPLPLQEEGKQRVRRK